MKQMFDLLVELRIDLLKLFIWQHRWSRSRSKERGYHTRVHQNDHDINAHDSEGTDYAADNSSDHSCSSATQSPRHKPIPYSDSPLTRSHLLNDDKRDSLSSQFESGNADTVRTSLTAAQVKTLIFWSKGKWMNLVEILF